MNLLDLISGSTLPLVLIGSEKGAGKTVTLNRLRAEARQAGLTAFGLMTAGWDGESRDHLTGKEKPRVTAYPDDLVLTAANCLTSAEARFELLWSDSISTPMGRMVLGRCKRSGYVELVAPPSGRQMAEAVARMQTEGVTRTLIDGAADRRTHIGITEDVEVGLVFRPLEKESIEAFTRRVSRTTELFGLDLATDAPPVKPHPHQIALHTQGGWRLLNASTFESDFATHQGETAWIGGPLTERLLQALPKRGVTHIVVRDPSRFFISETLVKRSTKRGLYFHLQHRPRLRFVAARCDGGTNRSLPPFDTLDSLRNALPGVPCFDPWLLDPIDRATHGRTR